MCSIIGSKSKETLAQLAQLNEYRGTHSHSLYVFGENFDIVYSHRGFGPLIVSDHPVSGHYYIAHQQAPTTDAKDEKSIHPAQINSKLLWHNGIIKEDDIKRLQKTYHTENSWDTLLLLMHYIKTGNVDDVDGTFACVLYDNGKLYLFRNEISPLFYNDQGDISSTKFADSKSLPANKILTFDPEGCNMSHVVAEFTTKENPYYFI